MSFATHLLINDFNYELPDDKIAQIPLEQRDCSRLLIVKNKIISESIFSQIHQFLPQSALLVFNDTRVIHARILFKKESGSIIEVFCLEPLRSESDIQLAFQQTNKSSWKCLVGNNKKWKGEKLEKEIFINLKKLVLVAQKIGEREGYFEIAFSWDPSNYSFAEVIESAGVMPLPPYIKRQAEESDELRYQTIYAKNDGSVAAPTAGLHFSESVMFDLSKNNIKKTFISLHVGAGTFKPVNTVSIADHTMHAEQISITVSAIEQLINSDFENIIAIGTTSVRTLESLYWMGVKLIEKNNEQNCFHIEQWDAYNLFKKITISPKESFLSLLEYLKQNKLDRLKASTQMIIIPGYQFRVINGMVTNFHQPQSTLLLLISAFLGNHWKDAYNYALKNNFRFLSYGDSCLFLK